MKSDKLYLVPFKSGWVLKKQGGSQYKGFFKQKKEAIKEARNSKFSFVIHNREGKFERHVLKKSKVKSNPNQHVIPHKGKWAVKCAGCVKPSKTFEHKLEASTRAKEIATNYGSHFVVHKKNGTIEHKSNPSEIQNQTNIILSSKNAPEEVKSRSFLGLFNY
ncbi:DUF2188 domain-containing protein [Candidatus Woesearchaeota archaeon]|jgi:hypothetical protein|nr:DUF2188 domain-containing protein [Candidatus Woesearchaeota archaeon]